MERIRASCDVTFIRSACTGNCGIGRFPRRGRVVVRMHEIPRSLMVRVGDYGKWIREQ